jgi:hypothetical protein
MDNPFKRAQTQAMRDAKAKFIQLRRTGMTVKEALAAIDRSITTYESWRNNDSKFRADCDGVALERRLANPDEDMNGDFAGFRKLWFDHDSPWFHLAAIEALEKAEPGSVTMVLFPPEHGKTTLMEDYICWKLATSPTHRFIVGSEKHSHSKKVVGRVKNRMEPGGPFPPFVRHFGPFAPQNGDAGYQPWGADYMNVRNKGNADERDYSLAALGFGAGIIGTRTDDLLVDDPQSTKTLSLTASMVETFRQDWLSRPGAFGKSTVWGSRVGEDDFYDGLIEAGIVDTLIMFPAQNSDGEWLWPERYSPAQYARLRKNVGEPGWQRNYMMRPQAAGESKFTQEMLDAHSDPLRAVWSDPPSDTAELAIGVDPGFGINATMVAAFCPGRMVILNGRADHNLRNNQEIISIVGEMIQNHRTPDKRVSQVIMEDKAFQKGLLNDESLMRLRERWGFQITGHNTGSTKNDEDFGVASMAAGFLRGEIVLPASTDPQTKAFRDALDAELKAWRPRRRGTQLRQDLVMSLWFLWLLWRMRRDHVTLGPSNWDTGAVPFNTKVPQLIVPMGAGGWSR